MEPQHADNAGGETVACLRIKDGFRACRQGVTASFSRWSDPLGRACGLLSVGLILLMPIGTMQAAENDCKEAHGKTRIEACTAVLRSNPENVAAYINRGVEYATGALYDLAIADLDSAIRLNPRLPLPYLYRANILHLLNRCQIAVDDYRSALRLDPQNEVANRELGVCLLKLGRFDDAIASYSSQIERLSKRRLRINDTTIWGVYFQRALAYRIKAAHTHAVADYDGAINDFTALIEHTSDPGSVTFVQRGQVLFDRGDYESAEKDFRTAAKLQPWQEYFLADIAEALAAQGKYAPAFEAYAKAIGLNENEALFVIGRGQLHLELGALSAALFDFKRALHLEPGNPRALLYTIVARRLAGMTEVDEPMRDALLNNPKREWPYFLIEMVLGQRTAEEASEKALNRNQQCEVQFFSGQRGLLDSQTTNAMSSFQRALELCRKGSVEYRLAKLELARLTTFK